jgi:SAM-dependent methyltransferase
VALALADGFQEVIGLDPEENMLAEARASAEDCPKVQWVQGRAEDIAHLELGSFQAVTLGQSFHWTAKEAVANLIYECLLPGGAMLLIHHLKHIAGNPELRPSGPPHPLVPFDVMDSILVRYLGRGRPPYDPKREPYAELLARTPFGPSELLVLPGRADLIRSIDDVIDNYLSASFAAPELFGDRLGEFRAELATVLARLTTTGFFWDWPGDTEVLIARKRSAAQP